GVRIVAERCIGVLRRGAAVAGVETSTGKTQARLVIDATGGSHWLARALGKNVSAASRPMIAWYGWATSARAGEFAEPRLSLHDDGWIWVAQTERDLCAWVRLDTRPGAHRRFVQPGLLEGFRPLG